MGTGSESGGKQDVGNAGGGLSVPEIRDTSGLALSCLEIGVGGGALCHADERVCTIFNGNRPLCVLSYSEAGDAEGRRLLLKPSSIGEQRRSAIQGERNSNAVDGLTLFFRK